MPYHDRGTSFPAWRAVRTHRYKYARTREKAWLLYDLENDPYEMHNLVDQPGHRNLQQRMDAELRQQMERAGDSWNYDFTEFIPLYNRTEKEYRQLLQEIRAGKFQVGPHA